jgi:tetratricopeptide (TPR) repeat protein
MKTQLLALMAAAFFSFGTASAQEVDCNTTLSLFSQSAKIKDYKSALPHYNQMIESCPKSNLAVYQYGERMFKQLIKDNKEDAAKEKEYAQALIKNYELRLENFPAQTKKGEIYADIAQVKFDNKLGTKEEQYNAFDKAWEMDKESFNSPKALYSYFNLVVNLQEDGKKDLQDVFTKYDELIQKIERQEIIRAEEAEPLIQKQEAGEDLNSDEKRVLSNTDIYLTNFMKIKGSINSMLGEKADCENLIPLYNKDFESKKTDTEWLKRAARRLSAKECDDPLFFKLVEALHQAEPSAKTAYYLGQLAAKDGNASKAMEYYNQSAELEEDPLDKAKVYYSIANNYKSKGSLSQARSYYRKALKNQPSLGRAYLKIAEMYAGSANNCGESAFDKRAVYWLAADYADRAGRVDPSLKSTASQTAAAYKGRAPQKQDIFTSDYKPGDNIPFSCWIGESVRVPSL